MGFYDLSKEERKEFVSKMNEEIMDDLNNEETIKILNYASDNDVYIRKNVSQIMGRAYHNQESLRTDILKMGKLLLEDDNVKVRQCAVYLLGEIGTKDASVVFDCLETGLRDPHSPCKEFCNECFKGDGSEEPSAHSGIHEEIFT
ncbi:MAG: HEAT repeat domain-containing protein [Methanobacterium sp.]|nr:HEAT repeat domain-containing protein [Methanobacterium sp.]